MITDYLNATDMKHICQARQFDAKCAKSKDVFETSFSSTQGLPDAIESLTDRERIFLSYIGDKTVDVSFFAPLYPEDVGRYGTYTQSYGALFKKVWANLVRKGLLSVTQRYADTNLERWRFEVPSLYHSFIPAPFKTLTEINEIPLPADTALRGHITAMTVTQGSAPKLSTYSLRVSDNTLKIGKECFSLDLLNKWQRRQINQICYPQFHHRLNFEPKLDVMFDVLNTALAQLKPGQFFSERDISPLIHFLPDPKRELKTANVCQAAADFGLFSKIYHNNKVYYGRGHDVVYANTPDEYLMLEKDAFIIDMTKVPYHTLETLTSICHFKVQKAKGDQPRKIMVVPDMLRLAKQDLSLLESPLVQWMCNQSPSLKQSFDRIMEKHGKILLHKNLLIAKVSDLRLKAQCIKAFEYDDQVKFLANDYMVFPKNKLSVVQKFVEKAGYAVKEQSGS
ncbi:hypothetical protein [Cysteiniphilum sp. 6C5]|uniref:hypothetical protein n=1 Tax=unclassified Cysteiniphilum TaxID=2610889 RepID=UPI003F869C90